MKNESPYFYEIFAIRYINQYKGPLQLKDPVRMNNPATIIYSKTFVNSKII